MFAVIFTVEPRPGQADRYLALAKFLKPDLARIDGYIDNERFASKGTEGRLLSLSIWRDEKALVRWRTLGKHHGVQEQGRFELFADYRLRVGEIFADSDLPPGDTLAAQRLDETEVGRAKVVTVSELTPAEGEKAVSADPAKDLAVPRTGTQGIIDQEIFESIHRPGKQLVLIGFADAGRADMWTPRPLAGVKLRHRHVRIIRDYRMSDRREAPQFYLDVSGERRERPSGRHLGEIG